MIFVPLPRRVGPMAKPPFLALAKVASTNAPSRFSCPRPCRCRASSFSASSSLPVRTHRWNRRWLVCYGGYFSGISRHRSQVSQNPENTRVAAIIPPPKWTAAHCSSFSSRRPVTGLRGYPRTAPGSHESASQAFMRLVPVRSLPQEPQGSPF
jgi:hypothetical protein